MQSPKIRLNKLWNNIRHKTPELQDDFLKDALGLVSSYPSYLWPFFLLGFLLSLILVYFKAYILLGIVLNIYALISAFCILIYFKDLVDFYKKWSVQK